MQHFYRGTKCLKIELTIEPNFRLVFLMKQNEVRSHTKFSSCYAAECPSCQVITKNIDCLSLESRP